MKQIFMKVDSMEEMPANCLECKVVWCRLGEMKNKDTILKKYQKQRHEKCPLVEISVKTSLRECLNCGRSMSEPKEESDSEHDRLWCSHFEKYVDEDFYCDEWC